MNRILGDKVLDELISIYLTDTDLFHRFQFHNSWIVASMADKHINHIS